MCPNIRHQGFEMLDISAAQRCGFFFLSLTNYFCRGNFSDQNYFIGCMLTNAAELSTLSLFPHHAGFCKDAYGDV